MTRRVVAVFLLFTLAAGCQEADPWSGYDGDLDADVADDDAAIEDADVRADAETPADDADLFPDAEADIETEVDAGDERDGSWERPFLVESLPYVYEGDTRLSEVMLADSYAPCAPATNEGGAEIVFEVVLDDVGQLRAEVDDVSGDDIDVDVHILDAPDPESCLARGNIAASSAVSAGTSTMWVVVDSWVNGGGVALEGPFTLWISLEDVDPTDCLTSPIECAESDRPTPNGVPVEAPGVGGCPDGMVPVSDFCIDQYEAMLVEVLDGGEVAPFSPYSNPGSRRVQAMSVAGAVPQGYISGTQAAAACAEAGKRLCSNEEWLLACQGAEGRLYPHGDSLHGECNTTRACHPAVQYFESSADWIWSELGHPCINQLPDGLATTGEYDACVTPEGIYDMVGNLHEWTSDASGIFRGGFYVDALINGTGCLYRTTAHSTGHWDYSTGFRCCF